jgi:hypothetical protein
MNTEEFINYLTEKEFNDKQINQLIKIREIGYDLIKYVDEDSNMSVEIIKEGYIKPTDNIEKLRNLKNRLLKNKYSNSQLTEILDGYKENIDYKIYTDIKYDGVQMMQIKNGLKNNINILNYCNEYYDGRQMFAIRYGLENNVDINKYNNLKYNGSQMDLFNDILIYNKENPDKEINILLFENEKIPSYEMHGLFIKLQSDDQDEKIEVYRKINEYNKEININNELDR